MSEKSKGNDSSGVTVGKAGGIAGLAALSLLLLVPLINGAAVVVESQRIMALGLMAIICLMSIGGFLGLVLGLSAKPQSTWSLVGIVSGTLAVVISLSGVFLFS